LDNYFKKSNFMKKIIASLYFCSCFIFISANASAEGYIPVGYKFEPLSYEHNVEPVKGRKTFTKDPNVWVYSSAFAKRFGMPEKWIDDSLVGAEAVAYRVQRSNTLSCGYFGDAERCRPSYDCIFDVYLKDEDSANIPWSSHKSAEWRNRSSSRVFLTAQKEEDHWYWYDEIQDRRYIRRGPTGIRSVVYVEGPARKYKGKDKAYSGQGPMRVREYRRDFYQGLDLIELSGCMAVSADTPIRIYFLDPQPSMRELKYRLPDGSINRLKLDSAKKLLFDNLFAGTPPHKVKLPDAYMDKVKVHDKAQRYEHSLVKEALKRLQAQKK
jgi:hypothetical protein